MGLEVLIAEDARRLGPGAYLRPRPQEEDRCGAFHTGESIGPLRPWFQERGTGVKCPAVGTKEVLLEVYRRLLSAYGPQGWWPGESAFEVAVGAILTQATNWRNAAKAIANLKAAGVLSPEGLWRMSAAEIAELIRPAGYFNQKAKRLRAFLELVREHGGLEGLFSLPTETLRERLLAVPGIGPETADSIVLYAAEKPSFVIDAYTRRILSRLGLIRGHEGYADLKRMFEENIPRDLELYKEYHALLVRHGKVHCRARPRCGGCPLEDMCSFPQKRG